LLLLQQISSENSRRNCTYGLGAYHFFLHTGDQHRKTTWSVEYDYGKFIVVAGLASRCTNRDP
jgi:hypothetical protein